MKNPAKNSHVSGYTVLVYAIVGLLALTALLQTTEAKEPEYLSVASNHSSGEIQDQSPSLYIIDNAHMHAAGEEFTVEVRSNSLDILINAVNARLGYSQESLEFLQAEVAESAFAIEAQMSVQDGIITIARGHIGGVRGDQLVAKLRFKALAQIDSNAIQTIKPQSAMLKHEDSSNIL